jgi:hypothetical protein
MPVPLMRRTWAVASIPQDNTPNGLQGQVGRPKTAVAFLPRWSRRYRHLPLRPCFPTPDTLTRPQAGLLCVWNDEIRGGEHRCVRRPRTIRSELHGRSKVFASESAVRIVGGGNGCVTGAGRCFCSSVFSSELCPDQPPGAFGQDCATRTVRQRWRRSLTGGAAADSRLPL